MLGSEDLRARDFIDGGAASKIFSASDLSERGQASGKRTFARGKVRGNVCEVRCARSFSCGQAASKNIDGSIDGSIGGLVDEMQRNRSAVVVFFSGGATWAMSKN